MKPNKSFVQMAMDWVRTGDANDLKEKYPPKYHHEHEETLLRMMICNHMAAAQVGGVPSYWLR